MDSSGTKDIKAMIVALSHKIDATEQRLMARIDTHDKFRSRLMGGLAVIVFIAPLAIEWFKH